MAGLAWFILCPTGYSAAQDCTPLPPDPAGAPAIRLTQHAFETGGPKTAILRTDAAAPVAWSLSDGEGQAILSGETSVFGADATSGDRLHRIAIDAALAPGTGYVLEACGSESRPFTVSDAPWTDLSEDALTYFYMNRLGEPVLADHLRGGQWARDAAGFDERRLSCVTGEDNTGTIWPGCDYALDVSGGWADAGDYGKYVVNGGISVWTLQNFVELADRQPDGIDAAGWADGRVGMPENGNGITDILDEARIHLDFMLAMQVPEGARLAVPLGRQQPGPETPLDLTEVEAGGLVHHKVHEHAWLPLPLLPADAEEPRHLLPPSTAATLNLAAAAAQCARVWRDRDDAFAARCLAAARRAYEAARAHPDIYAYNNFGGGGGYGDFDLADEFDWAAMELYAATGETRYLDDLRADRSPRDIAWPVVDLLPDLTLIAARPDVPDAELEAARARIVAQAEAYLDHREAQGYAFPFEESQFVWGSNGNLANRGIVLAYAFELTGEGRFRDAIVDAMDYLLGRNALDQSYVGGYGDRPLRFPHHRFWAAGADPEYPEAPPGALSGGPNFTAMVDPVAREMRGNCLPQRCWADHVDAYALNEVAINWNAPFFWIAAWLDSHPPAP